MALEFSINVNSFADALKKQPEKMYKYLRIANKRVGSEMEREAKNNHPQWTTRTGNLRDSIKYSYEANQGKGIELKLSLHDENHPSGTKYGKFQHDGTKHLKGDKWVERAFNKNLSKLKAEWQEAIDKANKEF